MIEHYTEAIVLERKPQGELDGSVTLYTKDLGKITAFTKSIRKITSKLSGHLMPGNKVRLRVVEQNSIQAVDALSEKPTCDPQELVVFLGFLNEVIPHGEEDAHMWNLINGIIEKCQFEPATYRYILGILGFGRDDAVCGNCRKSEIAHFSLPDIMFLCDECAGRARLNIDEIIKIKN
jgi:recombinational DNA repair protein (RecF pathway)